MAVCEALSLLEWGAGDESERVSCGVEADSLSAAIAITPVLAATAVSSAMSTKSAIERWMRVCGVCAREESVEVMGNSLLGGKEIDTQCW